jgi:ribonuclease HI
LTEEQGGAQPSRVIVYTDGACIGNPGPGGWGAVILDTARERELSGRFRQTTNNRMEMRAAIEALEAMEQPRRVEIYTDSGYLRGGITSWINNWLRNGWRTADKKPVKNADLWQRLLIAQERHRSAGGVTWHWVRGHAGHPLNERADRLANAAARGVTAADPLDVQTDVRPFTSLPVDA